MPNPSTKRRVTRIPPATPTVAEDPDTDPGRTVALESDKESPMARLAVPITTDGRIDVARLREKTKSALRVALSDPGLSVALGTSPLTTSDNPEDAALIKQITSSLFMGVSAVSVILAKRAGYRDEHAAVLVWDQSELETVAPLTGKLAKKYLPMLEGTYRDEILLSYQIVSIIGAKIMLLKHAAAQKGPANEVPAAS